MSRNTPRDGLPAFRSCRHPCSTGWAVPARRRWMALALPRPARPRPSRFRPPVRQRRPAARPGRQGQASISANSCGVSVRLQRAESARNPGCSHDPRAETTKSGFPAARAVLRAGWPESHSSYHARTSLSFIFNDIGTIARHITCPVDTCGHSRTLPVSACGHFAVLGLRWLLARTPPCPAGMRNSPARGAGIVQAKLHSPFAIPSADDSQNPRGH